MTKQGRVSRWYGAPLCVLWMMCAGCGGGDADPRVCTSGSDCSVACLAEGYILVGSDSVDTEGVCVSACTDNTECDEGMVCANVTDSLRGCVPACTTHESAPYGFGCIAGVPTRCSQAQPGEIPCGRCCDITSECNLCAADQFCDSFDTEVCQDLRGLGEACFWGEECASGNCSGEFDAPGVCQAGHGDPCDGSNCSRCINSGGTSFCHETCFGRLSCPVGFQNCLGSEADSTYWCHQDAGAGFACPVGYESLVYQEWSGAESRVACVPLSASFVCGDASIGPPCN